MEAAGHRDLPTRGRGARRLCSPPSPTRIRKGSSTAPPAAGPAPHTRGRGHGCGRLGTTGSDRLPSRGARVRAAAPPARGARREPPPL